jgi:hypothetical protein
MKSVLASVKPNAFHRNRNRILTRFYLLEETQDQICSEMVLTATQFRLRKSRAKIRFGELGKKKLAHRALNTVSLKNFCRILALRNQKFQFMNRCICLVHRGEAVETKLLTANGHLLEQVLEQYSFDRLSEVDTETWKNIFWYAQRVRSCYRKSTSTSS